ncbi:MAG: hypothetical protein ACFCD0_04410 [Gemmataceae bacterium]
MIRMSVFLMLLGLVFLNERCEAEETDQPRRAASHRSMQSDFAGFVCQIRMRIGDDSHLARIVVGPTGHVSIESLDGEYKDLLRSIVRELLDHKLCQPSDSTQWKIVRTNKQGLPRLVVSRSNPFGKRLELEDGDITVVHTRSRWKTEVRKYEYQQDDSGKRYLCRARKTAWAKPEKNLLSTEIWTFGWGQSGLQLLPKSLVIDRTEWKVYQTASKSRRRQCHKVRITLDFEKCCYLWDRDCVLLVRSGANSHGPKYHQLN